MWDPNRETQILKDRKALERKEKALQGKRVIKGPGSTSLQPEHRRKRNGAMDRESKGRMITALHTLLKTKHK